VYRESLLGTQQQLLVQFGQQALKPTEAPCRFHAHAHTPATQAAIKLCSFFGVHQAPLAILPALFIKVRNLLESRMKITAYNHHLGSFPSELLGRVAATNLLGWREPTLSCNHLPRFDFRTRQPNGHGL
jgi:hypothetical protein